MILSAYVWCVCVQRNTFQFVLTTDGDRHVMIFHYGAIDHKGTVNYWSVTDLSNDLSQLSSDISKFFYLVVTIVRISADHDQRRIQDLSKGADYNDRGAQAYIEGLHGESASRVQRKSPEHESFFHSCTKEGPTIHVPAEGMAHPLLLVNGAVRPYLD